MLHVRAVKVDLTAVVAAPEPPVDAAAQGQGPRFVKHTLRQRVRCLRRRCWRHLPAPTPARTALLMENNLLGAIVPTGLAKQKLRRSVQLCGGDGDGRFPRRGCVKCATRRARRSSGRKRGKRCARLAFTRVSRKRSTAPSLATSCFTADSASPSRLLVARVRVPG